MTVRGPLAEDSTVDTGIAFDDDLDLDALMVRVRDAAMAGASGSGPVQPQARAADAGEADLIRVLEAQGDWNEHARQDLVALLDAIRTLRDDWNELHAALRREIAQLSAQVDELRGAAATPAARRSASGNKRPHMGRTAASPRRTNKRRAAGGRRSRS